MNTRKIGDALEDDVLEDLNTVNGKKNKLGFTTTANSGAKWSDGDLTHPDYVIECKVKSTQKGFSAPNAELKKVKEIADKTLKDWIYVQEISNGRRMVLMDYEAFMEITEEHRRGFIKDER